MFRFESFKKKLSNNRLSKYLLFGGFAFFLIKGLVWLALFIFASFSLINNF